MVKRILLLWFIAFFMIFLCAVAYAQESESEFELPTYEANESIDYRSHCIRNGESCSSNLTCTYTVYYPDDSELVYRGTMDFIKDGIYNYTIGVNLTNVTGIYNAYVRCEFVGFPNVRPNIADGSFRVVPQLLYEAGFMSWEIAVTVALALLAMFLAFIATKMEHAVLQIGFIIFAIFLTASNISIMQNIVLFQEQTTIAIILGGVYNGFIWLGVFLVAFLVIKVLADLFRQAKEAGKIRG